jgi:tRNA uridine 5-carboxymethylaminomethyl modification enzyme
MRDFYDIIVIGGGHAGTEAAWAASSMLASRDGSARVALVTMDPSKIGTMSCNPAIGGLAKGQMVREIDALGGLMGLATDATGIMFKMLNTSKGAAVRGPRAQCDKYAYACEVQRLIATRPNIDVIAGTVDDIMVENGRAVGVVLPAGSGVAHPDHAAIDHNQSNAALSRPVYPPHALAGLRGAAPTQLQAYAVILTTGTFMRALMHTGDRKTPGGRVTEGSAVGISHTLCKLGLDLGRLKTGTPPRLARESIDWESLPIQIGDEVPVPFSDLTSHAGASRFPRLPQVDCRVTATTAAVHELIRANLHRAPMYSGQIDAECGPRYCPSIEDKVVRFAQRESHHVFLEPESLHTDEIYCNGISTSLPGEVQEHVVRMMPGCENARILRYGYAVEYDMVWPHQIDATGMVKSIPGLFLAGQINGTSGYEEAGGQGLVAGLNAARLALSLHPDPTLAASHQDPFIRLGRDQAYLGVMMDDLVTRTPREPYRMFTSRAEHRLHLRADNADDRLTPLGRELGLVDDARWKAYEMRRTQLDRLRHHFDQLLIDGKSLRERSRRPETTIEEIAAQLPDTFDRVLIERVMTEAKYDGYIKRQSAEIRRQSQSESQRIPEWIDETTIEGMRAEAAQTLRKFKPRTMGQASRLAGLTPADLTLLSVVIRRGRRTSMSSVEAHVADTGHPADR